MDDTMKETEDIELNASKFYLKANMVVDHPHEIEKNEKVNNYAYDVVYKKKSQGEIPKRENLSKDKAPMENTKETLYSTQGQLESDKDIIGDEETLR